MYSILVADDEISIRMMLIDYLEDKYEIAVVEDGETGLSLCRKRSFDMIISDINMPGMKGPEFLNEAKKLLPSVKTALITAYNIDDYIHIAKQYGISNIIPKTTPFNFDELDKIIENLLTGKIFGLSKQLLPGFRELGKFCIKSSKEAKDIREKITALLDEKLGTSGNMNLVLDEIITNAIYHAPAFPDGTQKYAEFTDITLEDDEYVCIELGYDTEKYAISISDSKGRLTKDVVLYKIDRQIAGEGILDDSGRGIHMSRLFSDRMIINIEPKNKTEIILMNYFSHKYRGYKPLYINEL
jgi:DNA-binding NarL/FixJ family response regulator